MLGVFRVHFSRDQPASRTVSDAAHRAKGDRMYGSRRSAQVRAHRNATETKHV